MYACQADLTHAGARHLASGACLICAEVLVEALVAEGQMETLPMWTHPRQYPIRGVKYWVERPRFVTACQKGRCLLVSARLLLLPFSAGEEKVGAAISQAW